VKNSLAGLRRYLYEFQFYLDITQIRHQTGNTITVSAARELRSKVEEILRAQGLSMDDARLPLADAQAAFHEVLKDVPGHNGVYADPESRGAQNPGYAEARQEFFAYAGFAAPGSAGKNGPLLPISPYDPRWAVRSTVKNAGSSLLFITDADIEQRSGGNSVASLIARDPELRLYSINEDQKMFLAGPAYSRDDLSGMTELMGYMTRREYRLVRDWVVDQDTREYMSEKGLARAKAVLDELQSQGVGYKIVRDRNRGQLAVHVEDTKISVRLTDTRANERFVGRVYDDGIATYFSTNYRNGKNGYELYDPSPADVVALLRTAQGLPVERSDGKGFVGQAQQVGEVYFGEDNGKKTSRFAYGSYVRGDRVLRQRDGSEAKVFIHRRSDRSETSTWFGSPNEGRNFIASAVSTASQRALDELGDLLTQFREHRDDALAGKWYPEFSGDEQIALIQHGYWDVLRGAQTTLLRPGFSKEDYDDAVSVLSNVQIDGQSGQSGQSMENVHDMLVGNVAYTGTPEERVREHLEDVVEFMFGGTFDSNQVRWFDPVWVIKYMISPYGPWRNSADLVAAMRAAGWTKDDLDKLHGQNSVLRRIRDEMIDFDPSTARSLEQLQAEAPDRFITKMAEVAKQTLIRNGVEVTSLSVDENGILDWHGIRRDRQGRQLVGFYQQPEQLHGQIGQIFEQGEHGEVVTKFGSGENYLFVPGYQARILPQKAGENLTMEQRTRLRGYEQIMAEQIRYQLAGDSLSNRTEIGGPTVLNGVYRRLYDERHEVDYLERAAERGLEHKWAETVLATEARRVRYPNEMADTFYEAWAAQNSTPESFDPTNDSFRSSLVLTGGRAVAVMDHHSDGFFDPDLTNASKPGVVRFLVEGAQVDAEGKIIPGQKDDRTPVMKHPEVWASKFNPYDRRQMTGMNLLHASGVTQPRGTALMTFGGWGLDDGIVVSKEFAQEHKVLGKDGQLRDLVVGDKLSDLHGNKGVISLIVDRERDYNKVLAEKNQSMIYATDIFRRNPELDVVMSPFSAVGRFNGGTARELMEHPSYLRLPFKGMQPGLMGQMRFIVTHKDVTSGTRVYDGQALTQGRGRKASAQLAWALESQGATEVLHEFYSLNGKAISNFREMLISVGLDMEPDGTLREGDAQTQEGRYVFEMPELSRTEHNRLNKAYLLEELADEHEYADRIDSRGGVIELPFPLRFPSQGADLPGREIPSGGKGVWRLPMLSSHLRTGETLDDGTTVAHEYTTQYLKIFEASWEYRFAQERLAGKHGEISANTRADLEHRMARAPKMAQVAFSTITSSLIERQFSSSNNVFKESLMSVRLPNSATAVWTADPRLEIDQLAMSKEMAQALGVNENEYVLIWRDPVLRDAGVRYLRVAIDNRLTGVAINPVMDKGFDGDFDGDSVAVVKLRSKKAHADAMSKLTVEANLLDLGAIEPIDMGNGRVDEIHPLMMQNSLDIKVTQSIDSRYIERFGKLTMRANENRSDFDEGTITWSQMLEANRDVVAQLSVYYKEVLEGQYGDAALSFEDPVRHLESVKRVCIDTGAKGSPAKLAAYAKHLGIDEHGVDQGEPLHTREQDQGVMIATAVKTAVGIAGAYSQRGVKALRNATQKSVLELTYPVTQSLLQSKHDPQEAMHKYTLLLSTVRELWRGRLMERTADQDGTGTSWKVVTNQKGAPVQATPQQWREAFLEMYRSKDGLNIPSVNPEHVDIVAKALTGLDGRMRNIEAVGAGEDRQLVEVAGLVTGSTMDRLAYGGTYGDLCAAAQARENIFGGEQNGHFAPYEIRQNQREVERYQIRKERAADPTRPVPEPEFISLQARDVLAADNPLARERDVAHRSQLATTVRAPRPLKVEVAEPTDLESDGFEYGF